jgi:hypothetical protein
MNKHQIKQYIDNFKYSPACVASDGKLSLTSEQALDSFKGFIDRLTYLQDEFWRDDLRQELRLTVLECMAQSNSRLRHDIVVRRIKQRFDRFVALERNRGMTSGPLLYDEADLIEQLSQYQHDYSHIGHTIIFHNKLV